jgi:acyl-CoA thioester hydrolase
MAFAVRQLTIAFLRPARIDDILTVETRTVLLGGARIILDQKIFCAGTLLLEARVKIAVISPEGKPRRMPEAVAAILELGAPPA